MKKLIYNFFEADIINFGKFYKAEAKGLKNRIKTWKN